MYVMCIPLPESSYRFGCLTVSGIAYSYCERCCRKALDNLNYTVRHITIRGRMMRCAILRAAAPRSVALRGFQYRRFEHIGLRDRQAYRQLAAPRRKRCQRRIAGEADVIL